MRQKCRWNWLNLQKLYLEQNFCREIKVWKSFRPFQIMKRSDFDSKISIQEKTVSAWQAAQMLYWDLVVSLLSKIAVYSGLNLMANLMQTFSFFLKKLFTLKNSKSIRPQRFKRGSGRSSSSWFLHFEHHLTHSADNGTSITNNDDDYSKPLLNDKSAVNSE